MPFIRSYPVATPATTFLEMASTESVFAIATPTRSLVSLAFLDRHVVELDNPLRCCYYPQQVSLSAGTGQWRS
jgi:hypothetical protein